MKTFYLFLVMLLASATMFAQAKKHPLFEHFTQASCGPCAQQNPAFDGNILKNNLGLIHHVAYHTSWPGKDPMYDYNKTQSAEMVSYYGVAGVPDMFMDGGANFHGSPAGVTQDMIEQEAAPGSPVMVIVTQTSNGSAQTATVDVRTVGMVPAASYVVRVAVVEKEIVYSTPPGTNGEKVFPNVFRTMLTGTSGVAYTPASQGSSVTYSYPFTMDAAWKADQIYVIAWVESSAKVVLNSGSNLDPTGDISIISVPFKQGGGSGATNFDLQLTSLSQSERYRVSLATNAPSDWSASYLIDGTPYTTTADVTVTQANPKAMTLSVSTGSTPFLATYTFTIQSLDNPNNFPVSRRVYVMSGVTDLIVDNDGTYTWETLYRDGLTSAGCTSVGIGSLKAYTSGTAANALAGVKNIYWNAAWNFPALSDNVVTALGTFLDNGGKLLIAGQDIGWETWDPQSTYWTTKTRDFYTNYLNAEWLADGGTANNSLTANVYDAVYGGVSKSPIVDKHSGNMYPDELKAINDGKAAFYYNNNTSKAGCIRSLNSSTQSKVVYFGIGLEMVSSTTIRNQIMKLTYDWFNSIVSVEEFDAGMRTLSLAQNMPNPSSTITTVRFSTPLTEAMNVNLYSVGGKLIQTLSAAAGAQSVEVNTTKYVAGAYLYQLEKGGKIIDSKKMIVVK